MGLLGDARTFEVKTPFRPQAGRFLLYVTPRSCTFHAGAPFKAAR